MVAISPVQQEAEESLASLCDEIIRLENEAERAWVASPVDVSEIERAIAEIPDVEATISEIYRITATSLDKGTVLYGLRVLSKWGFARDELLALAKDYNQRGRELGKTIGHPYNIDPPVIRFFYTETPVRSMLTEGQLARVHLNGKYLPK